MSKFAIGLILSNVEWMEGIQWKQMKVLSNVEWMEGIQWKQMKVKGLKWKRVKPKDWIKNK